jgi:3-oxoacyl-[acyl-carrier protein] reductase
MTKRILVTGCTKGIGEAIARRYKEQGHYVIGTGTGTVKPNYIDEYIQCDFSNQEHINGACEIIANLRVDVLINNAGINIINNFCDIRPEDFLKVQQVNVYAPFRFCQSVLPHMEHQGWGRIVNVTSVWGKISKQGRASYSASKFAVDGFTVALANEYASKGILANCVAPGFINTDMTWNNLGPEGVEQILKNVPIGRLAKIDEVAKFANWLGSSENTYMSGQNIAIDGGFTRA